MNDYLEVMKELEGMRKQWSSSNLKFYQPIFLYGRLTLFMSRSSREANFPRILEPEVLLSCWQTPSHWSLSWAMWIQPPQYYLIIVVFFPFISLYCKWSLSVIFLHQTFMNFPPPCVPHSAPISSSLMWLSQQYWYSSRVYKIQTHSFLRGLTTRNPRLLSSAVIPPDAFCSWNHCLITTVAQWHSVHWRTTKEM
jgi:hypothetical protein